MSRDALAIVKEIEALQKSLKYALTEAAADVSVEAQVETDLSRNFRVRVLDPSNANEKVGHTLRVFRQTMTDYSQGDVANRIGVAQPLVSRTETGKTCSASIDTLVRHAGGLDAVCLFGVISKTPDDGP